MVGASTWPAGSGSGMMCAARRCRRRCLGADFGAVRSDRPGQRSMAFSVDPGIGECAGVAGDPALEQWCARA